MYSVAVVNTIHCCSYVCSPCIVTVYAYSLYDPLQLSALQWPLCCRAASPRSSSVDFSRSESTLCAGALRRKKRTEVYFTFSSSCVSSPSRRIGCSTFSLRWPVSARNCHFEKLCKTEMSINQLWVVHVQRDRGSVYSGIENHDINAVFKSMFLVVPPSCLWVDNIRRSARWAKSALIPLDKNS